MTIEKRKQLLREYMAIPRVSGYEKEMAYRLRDDLKAYTGNAFIDKIGNVIASFEGKDTKTPSLMIFAHMDTIGFIITAIDDAGFIKIDRMGGVPEKIVPGTAVLIGAENGSYITGVIGVKAYHIQSQEDKVKVDPLSSLFVDIGSRNRKQVQELGVEVGCPVSYLSEYHELLNDRISGTYLDDASGMVTLVELAEHLAEKPHAATVHLVGTVWEEFNARGAMIAARSVKTDMAICLLGPGAGDTPDQRGINNVVLEGGPAVTLFNFHGKGTLNGCVAHRGMYETLKKCAGELGINLQRSAGRGALSDTAYIQLEDMGIACIDMGCPDRYSHSMVECISLEDHAKTGRLLSAFIDSINAGFSTSRY
jgi:putative aminopeptidase FrvX